MSCVALTVLGAACLTLNCAVNDCVCAQVVNVSLPGQAPQLMDATEDIRLLQQELAGKAGVPCALLSALCSGVLLSFKCNLVC